MAKTKIQMQDVADILANVQEPFQAPAMLTSGTAYNAITVTDLSGNKRQIQDPSKTLRPAMGIERVSTKSIQQSLGEKGSNGELVWKIKQDDRIRFVGNFTSLSSVEGQAVYSNSQNDYLEVTFYGTGLNILTLIDSQARDIRASVDGGAEGSNLYTAGSTILNGRNYPHNQVLKIVSGLTLDNHTVKIRNNAAAIVFYFYGIEILNEASTIKMPPGRILANGKSASINSLQSLAYNSAFDGSPTLNGKGGRVLVYSEGSELKKALQQTESSALYLTSADHSNEDIIDILYPRVFGEQRSEDFSTLSTTASTRAFTLGDGTTSLVGTGVRFGVIGDEDSLNVNNVTNNFLTLTFVGTGLDALLKVETSTLNSDIYVDGTLVGNLSKTANSAPELRKIVSGLPYGTHTIKFNQNAAIDSPAIDYFVVYGPKKPELPNGAIELGEYFLLADFITAGTAGVNTIATGVLRKTNVREMTYVGTWSTALNANAVVGQDMTTTTTSDYIQYVFFGTGFEYRFHNNATSATWQFTVDGSTNLSGFTTSSYGAGITSFTAATGTLVSSTTATSGNGIRVSGLTLGLHTVRFTKTAGTGTINSQSFDLITPIHYPNFKIGSLALKPSVSVKQLNNESNIDLGKAKAWLVWDGVNNLVLDSYNISGFLRTSTGVYTIYFEKPFKTRNYAVAYNGEISQGFINGANTAPKKPTSIEITTANTTGSVNNSAHSSISFFGELAEEGDE